MAFYQTNLGILVLVDAFLFYQQRRAKPTLVPQSDPDAETAELIDEHKHENPDVGVQSFLRVYLVGHLLAFAGDWLQGPHLYAVYKYDKYLEERAVALLYATGFVSAALSAAFAGQLADKFGRKKACLIYCATYTTCCLSMLSDNLYILLLGKVLGGLSTTLLYSSFDAWMITEYHHRNLEAKGLSLATLYGWLTSLNSGVAITTGILGELLVSSTGTRVSPFLLASLVFLVAAGWISTTWTENFGSNNQDVANGSFVAVFSSAVRALWQDKRVFALTAVSSIFESMMYLFVFFWSSAIISARNYAGIETDPPFGLIFGCFMCAMMAGSMLFNTGINSHDITSVASVLKTAIAMGSISLLLVVILTSQEHLVFWAFCLIELCVGMYYPSMNFLKSNMVEDGSRAKIYSLMRLPLSIFVVLAHSLAEEGDKHRNNVFMVFGGALLLAFVIAQRWLQST